MGESKRRATGQRRETITRGIPSFLVLLLLLLAACQAHKSTYVHTVPAENAGTPRANPAYIEWLRQQSMLAKAEELTDHISGTSLLWRNSGTEERYRLLLREAPTWLYVTPSLSKQEKRPVFRSLAQAESMTALQESNIQGLYIAPTSETADIWSKKLLPQETVGITSFAFSPDAGDEKDFAALLRKASTASIQLGGTLLPAATGLGPDFMLETRGVTSFKGLYACIEIPKDVWTKLPTIDPSEVRSLSRTEHAALVSRGILPATLQKTSFSWANPSGWAVTGRIQGVDGNERRFAFCYDGTPNTPVLCWQDPSAAAKRLYAGAVIRHTGFQQQTLAGLSLKAFMGLDTLRQGEQPSDATSPLEPGISALRDISQSVHRYGGWSMTTEPYPSSVLVHLQKVVDFMMDHETEAKIVKAIETEDIRPILEELAEHKKCSLAENRLVRCISASFANNPQDRFLAQSLAIALPGLLFINEPSFSPNDTLNDAPNNTPNDALHDVPTAPRKVVQNTPSERAFAVSLKTLLSLRKKKHTALGTLHAYKVSNTCLVIVNALPDGGQWMVVLNFSRTTPASVPLPTVGSHPLDLLHGHPCTEVERSNGNRVLTLKPREARHLFLRLAK